MNRSQNFVFSKLRTSWEAATTSMKQVYQFCAYQPQDIYSIFRPSDDLAAGVKFNIGPVVFSLPERLGKSHQLYIAVEGWLSFEEADLRTEPLKTKAFGTKVSYFKARGVNLEHVFGAHYDLDEHMPGHPVFHAQLQSLPEMADHVKEHFRLDGEVTNQFKPQVRNIRIPCAQMDVFATLLQICADHLVVEGATDAAKAFVEVREKSNFFMGAAYRLPYLNQHIASNCYRSWHWYGGERLERADA